MTKVEFYFDKELKFEAIADTYRKAYHQELDFNYWRWRFLNNPYDDKVLISYIIENGTLAAYYAASRCNILINNNEYKFVLVSMAMTHPEYQGKGYLKLVAGELFKTLTNEEYIGALGFANANSHYGHRKYLKWKDLSILNNFIATKQTFKNIPLIKYEHYRFLSGSVDEDTIRLTTQLICCDQNIQVKRETGYLEWRLLNNPIHNYYFLKVFDQEKIKGIIFYKFYDGNIDIMEFFYSPESVNERYSVLWTGIDRLLQLSKESVQIWSNLHTEEHIELEKAGFRETSFITHMGIIPFVDNKELIDFRNWHFRFIDSDVF
jgi:hypothetical protein